MSISGDTVAIWNASGKNNVALYSGGNTVIIGGKNTTLTTDVARADFDTWNPSNFAGSQQLNYIHGYDSSQNRWVRVRTTESGSVGSASGTAFRLLTDSIQHGSTLITGRERIVDGSQSGGRPLCVSGDQEWAGGSTILGIQLKVIDATSPLWLGSNRSGSIPDFLNGYRLLSGDTVKIPIDKPENIRLWNASGQTATVTWMGFDF